MLVPSRRPSRLLLPASLLAATLLAGCAGSPQGTTDEAAPAGETTASAPSPAEEGAAEEAAAPAWGYEGDTGPEHWGDLAPEYELCSTGTAQTPIDLAAAQETDLPDPEFAYQEAPLEVLNNGHTIQVPSDGASTMTIGDTTYELAQFHFHTPSEHTVDGEPLAGELHLVHQDAEEKLAVVGVLLAEGEENPAIDPIVSHLPAEADSEEAPDEVSLNPATLLPESRETFQYDGSLTTPPCSEGVSWFVMTDPIEVSPAQLDALAEVMGENNRPVQPLNERDLREDTTSQS